MDWKRALLYIAIILAIIGGLAWLSLGLLQRNPIGWVNAVTFQSSGLERLVYVLAGIAIIWLGIKAWPMVARM